MKVSVIIPFYKGISLLEECIQSLIDQSYKNMEIILVCDRVEDDIDAFLKPYNEKLAIKVYHPEGTRGVAAARNYGLSVASGDYVYFLDSDDYIAFNTIELLVNKAVETNADFVYGRKIWTWLKRSIFMTNINTDDMNSEEEDGDEDLNSMDSQELNMEDGGESESSGSLNEEQMHYDESEEDGQSVNKDGTTDAVAKQRTAYYLQITARNGVRNISVLNLLMKRSIIEENQIRFNEKVKFLSDYPFLLQYLEVAKSFEYVSQAQYMKRNHIDPANNPSLSNWKGSKSYREYTEAYNYTIGLIKPDGEIRQRLDKKIVHYCIKYYAPRLRTNHDDPERLKKFITMHKIIIGVNKELLATYKGYDQRVLTAFYHNDIEQAEKLVNRHAKWMDFKGITKNKLAFSKYLYTRFFLRRTVNQNWVFCESFFGKSYSDSPKYIYEYLSKNYPGKYRFIWIINNKKTRIPYPHTKVKRFSIRYFYYLARCKYYIFNGRQPESIKKRKGNVFLQTWHGTPLKKLVFDLEDINAATPKYKNQTYKQSRAWDYLIAANQYSSDIFRRCFKYNKTMLDTGYPRNDILHHENKEEIAEQIKVKLGIPQDKKAILYAPTWRDDEFYTKSKYKFSLKLDLQLMKEKLGNEYVILLRTHYFIADTLDVTGLEDFAFNLSNYDDISELYLISDILITDYSSVFFDYANLKRPMLFFTYDLEKYRDVLRGFYIDIEEELPGPMLFTTEEIITAIGNIDKLQQEYHEKYVAFYDKYCSWEDGYASKRVAEAVFKLKGN